MMTRSKRITDNIAGVMMGLILATVVTVAMNWLWPEMRIVSLIISVLCWIFTSISTAAAQRHNLVRTSSSGWKYVNVSEADRRLSFREWIWGELATILLGAIVGLLLAGVTGKLSTITRWPVFSIVFLLWTAVVTCTISDRRRDW